MSAGPPSESVVFVRASASGSQALPGGLCPGLTLDVTGASRLGSSTTDALGDASFARNVPAGAGGATLWFQAVFPGTCEVSNPVAQTF